MCDDKRIADESLAGQLQLVNIIDEPRLPHSAHQDIEPLVHGSPSRLRKLTTARTTTAGAAQLRNAMAALGAEPARARQETSPSAK